MQQRTVVVSGAVAVDWNLARISGKQQEGAGRTSIHTIAAYPQWGGAAMLARFMEELKLSDMDLDVHCKFDQELRIDPRNPQVGYHQSYAIWAKKPKTNQAEDLTVWRVEQMLGVQSPHGTRINVSNGGDDPEAADLVLMDDSDPAFRSDTSAWPRAMTAGKAPWVVVKMTRPIADGTWWKRLSALDHSNVVAVMTADDLRNSGVVLNRGLSWEATLADLADAFGPGGKLAGFRAFRCVVVTCDTVGACVYERGVEPPFCLVCDPEAIEGTWQRQFPGTMMGYTSCLITGIARELLLNPTAPDLLKGVADGLRAQRVLLSVGYSDPEAKKVLEFPYGPVIKGFDLPPGQAEPFVSFQVHPRKDRSWAILRDRIGDRNFELASAVAVLGEGQLREQGPLCSFGKMTTIDRSETENYRSLVALIEEYLNQRAPSQPLSIAVFGAPGSGKSFGVTEVARSVLGNQSKKLVFNLSQLQDPHELIHALHSVRDESLSGRTPLVFWDEFDANLGQQPWGWLRYFLAPMQDGLFLDGQVSHTIGRSVFVFAGGTAESMNQFCKELESDEKKRAKVPDFISRIKGFVDVSGPNPKDDRADDGLYMIRRAVLLRSILKRLAPHLFVGPHLQIDHGVLNALLRVPTYKYGSRSLESILVMSRLSDRRRYERSCLPSESQLNLHVDGAAFLSLSGG
ncbi:MAG TPA: hypothetical protein VNT26_23900 [Candidatus Sulfotelmatobacter sp.]|nr:hypothetical protein [Candidatus Sulfotelmatobacter sp.]